MTLQFRASLLVLMTLSVLLIGRGSFCQADEAAKEPDVITLADKIHRESLNLNQLQERLHKIDAQMNSIAATRQRRSRPSQEEARNRLLKAPTSFTTKSFHLERKVAGNDLIYSLSAKNAAPITIMEAIAKTAGLKLELHNEVAQDRAHSGRVSLEMKGTELQNMIEIVAGIQGLDAMLDEDSILVGPITALSSAPVEERLREMAVASYHRALFNYPDSNEAPEAYMGVSRYHKATKFYAAAIQTAEGVLERFPSSKAAAAALLMVGSCNETLGRYEETRKYYYHYVDSYPAADNLAEILVRIGHTWIKQAKWSQAVPVFEQVIRECSNSNQVPVARVGLAKCLAAGNQHEKALYQLQVAEQYMNRGLQLPETSGEEMNRLGLMIAETLMKLDRYGSARVRLKAIIEKSPSPLMAERAYCALGDIYLAEDNAVAALEMYHGAMTSFPSGALRIALPFRICRTYLQMGLYDKVIETIGSLPPEAMAYADMRDVALELIKYHLENKDYQRAITLIEDRRWPHDSEADPQVLMPLARALYGTGKLDRAAEKAGIAAKLAQSDEIRAEACLLIGECHRKKNEMHAAAMAYAGEVE